MLEYNGSELLNPLELFAYWIKEREHIRLKKEAGAPKPWSKDPIFQTVYFTNVNRENDKVTKWIRDYYSDHYMDDMFNVNIVLARMVNNPATLNAIEYISLPHNMEEAIEDGFRITQQSQKSVWGGAYIITTHGIPMGKVQYLTKRVMPAALKALHGYGWLTAGGTLQVSCQKAYNAIKTVEGLGSFLAAQVVADLKNTPWHPLAAADDHFTFVAPGPGSIKGLSHIYGKRVSGFAAFRNLVENLRRDLEAINFGEYLETIDNQDLQNCLCEFDKYYRVRFLDGRSKRKYNGDR